MNIMNMIFEQEVNLVSDFWNTRLNSQIDFEGISRKGEDGCNVFEVTHRKL